jgi:hypothetical protein
MSGDKITIGMTKTNDSLLNQIVSAGRFADEMDAAKFAMAYAIKNGTRTGTTTGTGTKWNVGSFDRDGSLKSLVEELWPDNTEPYRLIEHLMNEGVRQISSAIEGGTDFYDILFPEEGRKPSVG